MKIMGIFASILLVACTDTSIVLAPKKVKVCSHKCKKSYGLANKYLNKQKQKRCEQKCTQNQKKIKEEKQYN